MSRTFKQLSQPQRYQIQALIATGKNGKEIAKAVGVHPSTISRELKRNGLQKGAQSKTYQAEQAQEKTRQRHQNKPKAIRFTEALKQEARELMLSKRWSPELIATYWKQASVKGVSHETLYQWIWATKKSKKAKDKPYRHLCELLRHGKRKGKRGNYKSNRGCITGRVPIDLRPAIVEQRVRFGDFEADLMIGKQTGPPLLVLVDRTSLYTILEKLSGKEADVVAQTISRRIHQLGIEKVHTMTFDNGKEFAKHLKVAQECQLDTYFTRPYTSQDKGTVENRIGLIRRWWPKGTDLNQVSKAEIKQIETLINNRPVRKHNYLNAIQKMHQLWEQVPEPA